MASSTWHNAPEEHLRKQLLCPTNSTLPYQEGFQHGLHWFGEHSKLEQQKHLPGAAPQ